MRALVAFFLDNLREILRLTAVWNPALTFGHDDSDEPSLVCALSPTKTLVPTLREDGGLAVARGWKHEELAGAAIGAGGGVVGRQLGGTWERRASDPADNEGEDAGADRAEIRAALRDRGGWTGGCEPMSN